MIKTRKQDLQMYRISRKHRKEAMLWRNTTSRLWPLFLGIFLIFSQYVHLAVGFVPYSSTTTNNNSRRKTETLGTPANILPEKQHPCSSTCLSLSLSNVFPFRRRAEAGRIKRDKLPRFGSSASNGKNLPRKMRWFRKLWRRASVRVIAAALLFATPKPAMSSPTLVGDPLVPTRVEKPQQVKKQQKQYTFTKQVGVREDKKGYTQRIRKRLDEDFLLDLKQKPTKSSRKGDSSKTAVADNDRYEGPSKTAVGLVLLATGSGGLLLNGAFDRFLVEEDDDNIEIETTTNIDIDFAKKRALMESKYVRETLAAIEESKNIPASPRIHAKNVEPTKTSEVSQNDIPRKRHRLSSEPTNKEKLKKEKSSTNASDLGKRRKTNGPITPNYPSIDKSDSTSVDLLSEAHTASTMGKKSIWSKPASTIGEKSTRSKPSPKESKTKTKGKDTKQPINLAIPDKQPTSNVVVSDNKAQDPAARKNSFEASSLAAFDQGVSSKLKTKAVEAAKSLFGAKPVSLSDSQNQKSSDAATKQKAFAKDSNAREETIRKASEAEAKRTADSEENRKNIEAAGKMAEGESIKRKELVIKQKEDEENARKAAALEEDRRQQQEAVRRRQEREEAARLVAETEGRRAQEAEIRREMTEAAKRSADAEQRADSLSRAFVGETSVAMLTADNVYQGSPILEEPVAKDAPNNPASSATKTPPIASKTTVDDPDTPKTGILSNPSVATSATQTNQDGDEQVGSTTSIPKRKISATGATVDTPDSSRVGLFSNNPIGRSGKQSTGADDGPKEHPKVNNRKTTPISTVSTVDTPDSTEVGLLSSNLLEKSVSSQEKENAASEEAITANTTIPEGENARRRSILDTPDSSSVGLLSSISVERRSEGSSTGLSPTNVQSIRPEPSKVGLLSESPIIRRTRSAASEGESQVSNDNYTSQQAPQPPLSRRSRFDVPDSPSVGLLSEVQKLEPPKKRPSSEDDETPP